MFCVAGAYCKVPCSFYRNSIAAMKYQASLIRHKKGEREQHTFLDETAHWITFSCTGVLCARPTIHDDWIL
jgi:hypothetical protein